MSRKKQRALDEIERRLEPVLDVAVADEDSDDIEEASDLDVNDLFEQLFQDFNESVNNPTPIAVRSNGNAVHGDVPPVPPRPVVEPRPQPTNGRPPRITSKLSKEERAATEEDVERVRLIMEERRFADLKEALATNAKPTVGALYALLYKRLHTSLYNTISPDKIDDYVQHSFIRLIETLGNPNGWHGDGSIEIWLRRIAKNAYIEHQRNKEYSFSDFRSASDDDGGGDDKSDYTPFDESYSLDAGLGLVMAGSSQDYYSQHSLENSIDIREALKRALSKIDGEQRPILILLRNGYSLDEIAKIINFPPAKVKRIHSSIVKLIMTELGSDHFTD